MPTVGERHVSEKEKQTRAARRAVVGDSEALKQLAALNAVKEEVAQVRGLVRAVEPEQERVVDGEEDAELREDGLDL